MAKNGPQRGLEPGRGRPEVPSRVVNPGSHCRDRRIRLNRGDEAGCHATDRSGVGIHEEQQVGTGGGDREIAGAAEAEVPRAHEQSRMGRVAARNVRRTVG